MPKIISQLDAAGVFVGPVEADASPLEPGVFLIPAGAVDVPPPNIQNRKFARYENGAFVFEDLPIPPPLNPAQIKAESWGAIKAERDRRKAGGVKVGAKWFHSDDASRIQQLALVMMGAGLPAACNGKRWTVRLSP